VTASTPASRPENKMTAVLRPSQLHVLIEFAISVVMAVAAAVGFGMMIVSVTLVTTPTGYMVLLRYGGMLLPALVAEDYYAASVKEN
jgi:archaellum biogenesis protein FlaJ (TadC family)